MLALSLCRAPGWGGAGEAQVGLYLKLNRASCVAYPWRRTWACFLGQLFPQNSKPQPHLDRLPLLSPIGKPSDWPAWVGVL